MSRNNLYSVVAATILLSGCAATPPSEDPVLIKLDDLERRLAAIERVLANGSLIDLTMQVDDLQRQNAALQGRTETLEYNAESTATRQRDLYVDVDDRLQTIERNATSRAVNVLDGLQLNRRVEITYTN